jgi:hypothetical protein
MADGAQAVAQNVSVSLTYGESKQTNTETTDSTTALASKVNAGNKAVLVATGGEQSDINIIGSDVSGKQGTTLFADNDINIVAAEQQRHDRSDNNSSGWNAGIAVSYGQGGASFGITAGANKGKGYGNGDEVTWRNSHVGDMDGQTTLISGGDGRVAGVVAALWQQMFRTHKSESLLIIAGKHIAGHQPQGAFSGVRKFCHYAVHRVQKTLSRQAEAKKLNRFADIATAGSGTGANH